MSIRTIMRIKGQTNLTIARDSAHDVKITHKKDISDDSGIAR